MIAFVQTEGQAAVFHGTRAPEGVAERWGGTCYCLRLLEPKPREKKGRQWEEVESIFPHFFLPSVSAKTEGEKRGGMKQKNDGNKQ